MKDISFALGIMAALLHGFAYILYNIQTKFGKSKPNAASWSIWTLLAIINAFTFREMSGDLVSTFQFFTGSVACTITFFFALFIGKLKWPKGWDWPLLILSAIAIVVWLLLKSAKGANMIVILAFVISFIPTYKGVLKDPNKEAPLPWAIWTIAFVITTVVIILRWQGEWLALVPPIGLIITHGVIAILSRKKRKAKFPIPS